MTVYAAVVTAKCILVGASKVGKTSIARLMCQVRALPPLPRRPPRPQPQRGAFAGGTPGLTPPATLALLQGQATERYQRTVGIDTLHTEIELVDAAGAEQPAPRVQLHVWDKAAESNFATLDEAFFNGARVGLLVFSSVDRASFERVKSLKRAAEKTAQLQDPDAAAIQWVLLQHKIDRLDALSLQQPPPPPPQPLTTTATTTPADPGPSTIADLPPLASLGVAPGATVATVAPALDTAVAATSSFVAPASTAARPRARSAGLELGPAAAAAAAAAAVAPPSTATTVASLAGLMLASPKASPKSARAAASEIRSGNDPRSVSMCVPSRRRLNSLVHRRPYNLAWILRVNVLVRSCLIMQCNALMQSGRAPACERPG